MKSYFIIPLIVISLLGVASCTKEESQDKDETTTTKAIADTPLTKADCDPAFFQLDKNMDFRLNKGQKMSNAEFDNKKKTIKISPKVNQTYKKLDLPIGLGNEYDGILQEVEYIGQKNGKCLYQAIFITEMEMITHQIALISQDRDSTYTVERILAADITLAECEFELRSTLSADSISYESKSKCYDVEAEKMVEEEVEYGEKL